MGIPHYTLYVVVVTAQSERARDAISARVAWPRATRARMEEQDPHKPAYIFDPGAHGKCAFWG